QGAGQSLDGAGGASARLGLAQDARELAVLDGIFEFTRGAAAERLAAEFVGAPQHVDGGGQQAVEAGDDGALLVLVLETYEHDLETGMVRDDVAQRLAVAQRHEAIIEKLENGL